MFLQPRIVWMIYQQQPTIEAKVSAPIYSIRCRVIKYLSLPFYSSFLPLTPNQIDAWPSSFQTWETEKTKEEICLVYKHAANLTSIRTEDACRNTAGMDPNYNMQEFLKQYSSKRTGHLYFRTAIILKW